MPPLIVATAKEEWIIGGSDLGRLTSCLVHGIIHEFSLTLTNHILVAISIDRFLFIVEASHHSKIMTVKVTLGILAVIWVRQQDFICISAISKSITGE